MPIYVCYRGDCDNLAWEQLDGSPFVAQDALRRKWLCIETTLSEMPSNDFGSVAEMIEAQRQAHKLGFSVEGTERLLLDCPDEAGLRRRLILETYPPPDQSMANLRRAGWVELREEFGTSKRPRAIASNGREIVGGAGKTWQEAEIVRTSPPRQSPKLATSNSMLNRPTLLVPLDRMAGFRSWLLRID